MFDFCLALTRFMLDQFHSILLLINNHLGITIINFILSVLDLIPSITLIFLQFQHLLENLLHIPSNL